MDGELRLVSDEVHRECTAALPLAVIAMAHAVAMRSPVSSKVTAPHRQCPVCIDPRYPMVDIASDRQIT